MPRSRALALVGICVLLWGTPGHSQERARDSAYADRALVRMVNRVTANPVHGLEPGDLEGVVELLDSLDLNLLSDSSVHYFLVAMTATIDRADSADCLRLLDDGKGGGSKGFLRPLRRMDSTTVDLWMTVFERALQDRAAGFSPASAMSQEEAASAFLSILDRLNEKDRARFMGSLNSQDPGEQCWAMRTVFGEMARMPIEEGGRIFRATQTKGARL